jgi:hypothetical protein
VSETGAGEKVVPRIHERALQIHDQFGTLVEKPGRGAGVIKWL